jgi:hypothetical protein
VTYRRPTTQNQQGRLSQVFWLLADPNQMERRDPESVVGAWLGAVDGLEGRRKDAHTTQTALAFLMRLESDAFYASPEQTRGGEKDSRGLVYSLALFLFERLTGHHPFVESLSPLECRIQQAKGKRVGTNNLCHLPKQLRTLLSRALSPFPEDRFEDIASMRRDVEAWHVGTATTTATAKPATATPAAATPATAMPAIATLATAMPATAMPATAMPATAMLQEVRQQTTASPTQPAKVARRAKTLPPPVPTPRKSFVAADTLQGAIVVSTTVPTAVPESLEQAVVHRQAPWLWPTISGGFALMAAAALFIAVQVATHDSSGKSQKTPAAALTSASSPAVAAQQVAAQEVAAQEVALSPTAPAAAPENTPASSAVPEPIAEKQLPSAIKKSSDRQIVDIVRSCVAPQQIRGGVSLGISVRFSQEGTAMKSFTGKLPFARSEVQCIKAALADVVTSSETEVGRMMSYDLYVSIASERTRARPAKH